MCHLRPPITRLPNAVLSLLAIIGISLGYIADVRVRVVSADELMRLFVEQRVQDLTPM